LHERPVCTKVRGGHPEIGKGIAKKGGTKKLNKVYGRLGRLKQIYPSVHSYYE